MNTPRKLYFEKGPDVPNITFPALLFRSVLPSSSPGKIERFRRIFKRNGWVGTWTDTIYDYTHFHSNAHEVLGIAKGAVTVLLGGETTKCSSRKGHPWQRHRPCDLPENRSALQRRDLGGIGRWKGIDFPLYFSGGQASKRMSPRRIVLIEDNPADVLLVQKALEASGVVCEMTQFESGLEALRILCPREGKPIRTRCHPP